MCLSGQDSDAERRVGPRSTEPQELAVFAPGDLVERGVVKAVGVGWSSAARKIACGADGCSQSKAAPGTR